MDEVFYEKHATVTKWMDDFEERCKEHFTWLDEVLHVAAENYQKTDVEVLPKTPSVKKKVGRRRKPPIVLSSEDDDFVDPPPRKAKRSKVVSVSEDVVDLSAQPSSAAAAEKMKKENLSSDDVNETEVRSTRSTRSSKSTTSTRSTRSSRSTRSTKSKKKANNNTDDEEEDQEMMSIQNHSSMESISELDEETSPTAQAPIKSLFKISEGGEEEKDEQTPINKPCSSRILEKDHSSVDTVKKKIPLQTPVAEKPAEPVLSEKMKNLKKTLTPVSPKVKLHKVPVSSDDNLSEAMDTDSSETNDHDGSFAGLHVKDKVRAYDNLLNKLSPAASKVVANIAAKTPPTYKSTLNVTLSSERLPERSRVIRQVSGSPMKTTRLSKSRKSSIVVSRRSSLAENRKSSRLSKQASRMSLAKRKSFLLKNRASVVLVRCDDVAVTSTPVKPSPQTVESQSSSRKRNLPTDSDSSQNGTPSMAKKKIRSDKCAPSPRVKKLKKELCKSSDSEYVTDDSDVPMTPGSARKRNKWATPPTNRAATLISGKTPPVTSMAGSFIKRNTPKTITLKERQEKFKQEMLAKRAAEERRLERIKTMKQQEVDKQKRKREERFQQVQAKRLAQEKAATEQSMTSVKSKEKRGSAIMREQREKIEQEKMKRAKKQAEVEERRRLEEERRLKKLREKEEEARMVQAMMQRKKEYEEQERLRKQQEERRLAEEKRKEEEKRREEERRKEAEEREAEQRAQRLREQKAAIRAANAHNTSLNSTLNKTTTDELQTYNIDDIRSDDETDDEDAPKKEIPPWASGHRMKALIIHQHYKQPVIEDIFPPSVLLVAPDLTVIFPKQRPRFQKRTSSAVWSPINKHYLKNLA